MTKKNVVTDAHLKLLGLDPKKLAAEAEHALRQIILVMLQYDSRISMSAAFMALACFLTQRVPDELTMEFTDIYKELVDRLKPLRLTKDESALMAAPLASTKVN